MGGIPIKKPEKHRAQIKHELAYYMDQQRWMTQHTAESWVVIECTRSPARILAELTAITSRMNSIRLTYKQIELCQSILGLSTVEGGAYG